MEYLDIREEDYRVFHQLAAAYYREGEDADTPQEQLNGFIRLLFEKVVAREIRGCVAVREGCRVGFALWAADTEEFAFSQLPGFGTVLEIGLVPGCRRAGLGKEFVRYIEKDLRALGLQRCYVCAYGPAQTFWLRCGYSETGQTAHNGLAILTKTI